jgi:hypothetical protein
MSFSVAEGKIVRIDAIADRGRVGRLAAAVVTGGQPVREAPPSGR